MQDGLPDLVIGNGPQGSFMAGKGAAAGFNQLFRNLGGGNFEEVKNTPISQGIGTALAVAWGE